LTGSVSAEIVARVTRDCWDSLSAAPQRLATPDFPEATSPALTEHYNVRAEHIARKICATVARDVDVSPLAQQRTQPHDVPGSWFSGPF
jgi:pyruvate dehydrogenase E1 component beta subunit